MFNAQRILLAGSCLLCFGLLKHLWRHSLTTETSSAQWSFHNTDGSEIFTSNSSENATAIPSDQLSLECQQLHGLKDIALILKTGATEIYEKLPIHLATTFPCAPYPLEYLVYSDVGQRFGSVVVRDALGMVSQDLRDTHPDLAQYRRQRKHIAVGADAEELKGEQSWGFDKYKFLPMISDAYRTFGQAKKWYVFIEADTYVSLHNLLIWLGSLDAGQSLYAGAQVMIGDTEFAHGGSGFVLSAPAAESLTNVYEERRTYWEREVTDTCCGDKLVAEVLLQANPPIQLYKAFPVIQGETLTSLDWSPTHWCRPAVTWHHVDAAGIDKLWQFERQWRESHGTKRSILFADYYDAFIHKRLITANGTMEGWDNLSNDWEYERGQIIDASYESAEACK